MIKSTIVDTFYPTVSKIYKDKRNSQELVKIISKYIDSNSERLSTTGPVKRLLFTDKERNAVHDLTTIDDKTISLVAKKVPDLARGVNTSNPFNILMVLIIRFFRINKMDSERKAACLYLMLSMYPSIHKKYFKFEPNENIMSFTVNSLSNKYKLKQQGTLLATLIDTAMVCDEHYKSNLIRGNDKDIADYIAAVKTRLNSFMKNIFSEFIKQHASGRYLNYDTDNDDPDKFSRADSNSLVIERMSGAVVLSLSVSGPDSKCILLAAKMSKVSVNDLRFTVNQICKDKKNKEQIRELVSAIVYDFLFAGEYSEQDIHDMKFTIYALNTYKKSNTINTNIVQVKKILDAWLSQYSERYKKTNLVGTLNLFRKALYMFFVFTIQKTKI